MNEPDDAARQDAMDEQAAWWAGRLAGDELSEADHREFATWLQADPQHRKLLAGYVALSRQAGRLMPELFAQDRIAVPAAPPRPFRPWLWSGAALAATAAALFLWMPRSPSALPLATPAATRATHALADGTQVDLNARTTLEVDFGRDLRRVQLSRGEALFAVTKDPDRPFVVVTPAGEVRVTGTRFNVRLETDDVVEVTVLEGCVTVTGPRGGPPQQLQPGDRLVLRGGVPDLRKVPLEELQDAIAWRQGRLVLDGVELGEAVRRFAQYHGRSIEVSPAVAKLKVGGAYPIDDVDGFIKAVERMLPAVKATTDAEGRLHLDLR